MAIEVPESWNLDRIRTVVQGVRDGSDLETFAKLEARQVGYHLQAARVLGWLTKTGGEHSVTPLGHALLTTPLNGPEEATIMRESLGASALVQQVLPQLLSGMTS